MEMTMRTLSVTISDELYNSLKHEVPSRQISKFVSVVLTEKLAKKREYLYLAYLAASQDTERETELSDWDDITMENWDKD